MCQIRKYILTTRIDGSPQKNRVRLNHSIGNLIFFHWVPQGCYPAPNSSAPVSELRADPTLVRRQRTRTPNKKSGLNAGQRLKKSITNNTARSSLVINNTAFRVDFTDTTIPAPSRVCVCVRSFRGYWLVWACRQSGAIHDCIFMVTTVVVRPCYDNSIVDSVVFPVCKPKIKALARRQLGISINLSKYHLSKISSH